MTQEKDVEFKFSGVIPTYERDYFLAETEESIIADFEQFYTTPRVFDSDERKFLRFVKIYMTNRPTPMRVLYSPSPLVPDLKRFYDKWCKLKDMVTEYEFLAQTLPFIVPKTVKHFEAQLLWTISEFWMMTSEEFAQSAHCWSDDVKMTVRLVNNKMRNSDYHEVPVDEATKLSTGLPKLTGEVRVPPNTPYIVEEGGSLVSVPAKAEPKLLCLNNQALCSVGRPSYDALTSAHPDMKIGLLVRLGEEPITVRCVDVDMGGRDSYLLSLTGGSEIDPGLERAYRDALLPYEYTEMLYQLPNPNSNYHTVRTIPPAHLLRAIKFAYVLKPDDVWGLDSEIGSGTIEASYDTDDWAAVRLSDGVTVCGTDKASYQSFLHHRRNGVFLVKDPSKEFRIARLDDQKWLSGGFRGAEWTGFMDVTEVVRGIWTPESKKHRHRAVMGAGQVASKVKWCLQEYSSSQISTSWLFDSPTYLTVHKVRSSHFGQMCLNPSDFFPTYHLPCRTYEDSWVVVKEDCLTKSTAAMNKPVFPHLRSSSSAYILSDTPEAFLREMARMQVPRETRSIIKFHPMAYLFPNCPHIGCLCHVCISHGDDTVFIRVCELVCATKELLPRMGHPVLDDTFAHPTYQNKLIMSCAKGFGPVSTIPYRTFNEKTGNMEIWDTNPDRTTIMFESNGCSKEAQEALWARYKKWWISMDDPDSDEVMVFDDLL